MCVNRDCLNDVLFIYLVVCVKLFMVCVCVFFLVVYDIYLIAQLHSVANLFGFAFTLSALLLL